MIDYLRERPNLGIPVFYYFSFGGLPNEQLLSNIVSSFIRQLAVSSGYYIPKALERAYKSRSKPNLQSLINIFKEYCQGFPSTVFVLFDALNECAPAYRKMVVSLIFDLNASGIRIFMTMRKSYFRELDVVPFNIKAREKDMWGFVQERSPFISSDFHTAIIEDISSDGENET
jgi:hypothetical protein